MSRVGTLVYRCTNLIDLKYSCFSNLSLQRLMMHNHSTTDLHSIWGSPSAGDSVSGCSLVGILLSPLSGLVDGSLLVGLPVVGNALIEWVIAVWCRHQSLDGKQNSLDLEGWGPLVLEDIETDTSELVNVWMVNLGSEEHLWWDHWVVLWQVEFELEHATLIWAVGWARHLDEEVSAVSLGWLGIDTDDWLGSESLCLLKDSGWNAHVVV